MVEAPSYSPLSITASAPVAEAPAAVIRVQDRQSPDSKFALLENAIKNGDRLMFVDPLAAGMLGFPKPGEVQVTMGVDEKDNAKITIRTPEKPPTPGNPNGTPRQQKVVGNLDEKDMETLVDIMSRAKTSQLPTLETHKDFPGAKFIIGEMLKKAVDTALAEKKRCKQNKPGEHCI